MHIVYKIITHTYVEHACQIELQVCKVHCAIIVRIIVIIIHV